MKFVLFTGALLIATATDAHANPWDLVPDQPPYKSLADSIKATAQPGQASPLNPSCEGMTGDACVKSAQSSQVKREETADASKPSKAPEEPRD